MRMRITSWIRLLKMCIRDRAWTADEELKAACVRLWKNVTEKRMYITGGVGSGAKGETFTVDYDLPNDLSLIHI